MVRQSADTQLVTRLRLRDTDTLRQGMAGVVVAQSVPADESWPAT